MATPRVALETRSTIRRSPDLGRGRGAEGASRKMELHASTHSSQMKERLAQPPDETNFATRSSDLRQNEQRSIFEASYRGE